jgi:osmoprotectant transport system permease protein
MAEQLALLPGYLAAHLQLVLVSLLLGTAVSIPLGIAVTRRKSLEPGVLGIASVIQTIPSLALLAIMVPALAAVSALTASAFGVELSSIGYTPALVALSLYSILPILRNTVTGIRSVDPSLIEAARGVGMTDRQQLLRVELPLAMPVIVAGLRTATVWVVGTATLSTPVGATSLGNYIFSGLQTRNTTAVLVGCIAAAGLAIVLDQLIRALEVAAQRRRRAWFVATLGAITALYAATALSFAWDRIGSPERTVTIGSKTFTEQYILSEILAGHIASHAGTPTRAVQSLGSTVAFDALRSGDLDLYVDYDGTIWATIMKRDRLPRDRSEVTEAVRRFLRDEHGITVIGSLGFENTYALGMRAARARGLGIERIGQLAPLAAQMEIGGDYEFFQRPEWASIQAAYGLAFGSERSMDSSLMYEAVARGEVDVISAFSTDGRIAAFDITLLEDDRGVIPPYAAILLASPKLAEEMPAVIATLEGLVGTIDADAMRRMNLAVDRDHRSPADVAREFLDGLAR